MQEIVELCIEKVLAENREEDARPLSLEVHSIGGNQFGNGVAEQPSEEPPSLRKGKAQVVDFPTCFRWRLRCIHCCLEAVQAGHVHAFLLLACKTASLLAM